MKGKKQIEKGLIYVPYIISEVSPSDFNNFDIEKLSKSRYSLGTSISTSYLTIKIETPINEIRKEKINSIKKTIK
jgi:hypothetical protein